MDKGHEWQLAVYYLKSMPFLLRNEEICRMHGANPFFCHNCADLMFALSDILLTSQPAKFFVKVP